MALGRVGLVGLLLVAASAGCGAGDSGVSAPAKEGAAPLAWMRQVQSRQLAAAVVEPAGTGALVYGGYDGDGVLNRKGGLLDPDGSVRAFRTDLGLVGVSVVETDDGIYLAGQECEDPVEVTDTGVQCSPNVPVVYRLDEATLAVGRDFEDPLDGLGAGDAVELHVLDGDVVVEHRHDGTSRLITRSEDGGYGELPSPPEGIVDCSDGSYLYTDLWSQGRPMTDAEADRPDPPDGPGPGLSRYSPVSGTWEEVAPPPGGFSYGARACSDGHLVHLPASGPVEAIWVLDEDLTWSEIGPLPDELLMPVFLSNPDTATFVLTSGQDHAVVDPTTASVESFSAPAPGEGAPSPSTYEIVDSAGTVRQLTDALTLEPVR